MPASVRELQTEHKSVVDPEWTAIAAGLVYLSEKLGQGCEPRVAERLVADAARCWPGPAEEQWWKWLQEAGRSLSLELRVADIERRDLAALVCSGRAVVAGLDEGNSLVVVERRGRRGRRRRLDGRPLSAQSGAAPERERVVLAEPHPAIGGAAGHGHPRPLTLLLRLIDPEWKDIGAVCALSAVAGLLMISVPVTAQQLVRAVTFASLYQPILVLSVLLLLLLGFVAALQALQNYVAEVIQRRLFVRTATTVSRRLPRAAGDAWREVHPPELVNRFLDISIVQKVAAGLLVDGVGIVLTTLIGMCVMAFYHPYLLGYDVALLVLLTAIVFGFGRSGVKTAVEESRAKYQILSWLEDVAGARTLFRTAGTELLATQRTDALCATYLTARRRHFRVLLRQIVLILVLQALATTTLLGLGGYLVLQEQLTLGQLVAAELIVATIVTSFAKLGKHLEGWYDLLAAADKLSYVTDLESEPVQGLLGIPRQGPAAVQLRNNASTKADGPPQSELEFEAGGCVALFGWGEAATARLAEQLLGRRDAADFRVALDGIDAADLRPDVLRSHITVVRELEFFTGTVAENVHLHRPEVGEAEVVRLLEHVGLTDALQARGLGATTLLLPDGRPLTPSEARRLTLARGLAGRPRALFVDHVLDGLPDRDLARIASWLATHSATTTVLIATEREQVAQLCAGRVACPPPPQ